MASSSEALSRRWTQLCRSQQLARRAAMKRAGGSYMDTLKAKIPDKAREKLEWAFCKGFGAVFEYGEDIIDKSYDRKGERRRGNAAERAVLQHGRLHRSARADLQRAFDVRARRRQRERRRRDDVRRQGAAHGEPV